MDQTDVQQTDGCMDQSVESGSPKHLLIDLACATLQRTDHMNCRAFGNRVRRKRMPPGELLAGRAEKGGQRFYEKRYAIVYLYYVQCAIAADGIDKEADTRHLLVTQQVFIWHCLIHQPYIRRGA